MANAAQATKVEREVSIIMKLVSLFSQPTWLDCFALYASHIPSCQHRFQHSDDASADATPHPERSWSYP